MEDSEAKLVLEAMATVLGRFCGVLRTRGIITKYDHEYICGEITSEEWAEKFKEEQDPANFFKALFNDNLFNKGED